MDTRSNLSSSATTEGSDLRTKFLDAVEAQWPGSTRIARLIVQHDEWLKRKFTDGRSWYDIISDSMESQNDDGGEYIYDDGDSNTD
jgi:hypothetical protein